MKSPFLFTMKHKKAFTFAGLWESWVDPAGSELRSCTLITTEPNELIGQYHDRMPVILDETARWEWLSENNAEELKALLVPYDANAMDTPVRIENITA
jgi:putative SOS response-associated peptidase YedK